jgi:hypothetical protein
MNDTIVVHTANENVTDLAFARLRAKKSCLLTGDEAVHKAFAKRKTYIWITFDTGALLQTLGALLQTLTPIRARKQHRLLVLQRTAQGATVRLEILRSLFSYVTVLDEPFRFLSDEELEEALTSANPSHLAIAAAYDAETETVCLLRGNLEPLIVPATAFKASPLGIRPNFMDMRVIDYGQTLQLGDYEASVDALLYEFDRDYRRKLKKQRAANECGLGASIRRLRLQRGLTLRDIHDVSAKEIARIERGEIKRPQKQTLELIARALQVSPDELEDF